MITTELLEHFNTFSKNTLDNIDSPSETIKNAIQYSFFSGGKRIRAQFVYSIGSIYNIALTDCHKIAFAVEAIHTYSLIHDDLPAMDNDALRRGKPTCHIKYNESTAILAGDALQALAFEVMQDIDCDSITQLRKITKLLAQCCGISGMVSGQQLDMEGETKQLTLEELEIVHLNKTAKMFIASIVIPYILSKEYNHNVENILIDIAKDIGLLFQIQDDILDVTSTTEKLGKTSAKDIHSGKSTYVSLLGLSTAKDHLTSIESRIKQKLDSLNLHKAKVSSIKTIISTVVNRKY